MCSSPSRANTRFTAGVCPIDGAGIASSFSESPFAMQSDSPSRIGFELERVMRTYYRIDDFQESYFVLVFGDWTPKQNQIGWIDSTMNGGVTTMVSGEVTCRAA